MPDVHNVESLWQCLWSVGDSRQHDLKGEELSDHTPNVFCSGNKKAQQAVRHKVSVGVTGQREMWLS